MIIRPHRYAQRILDAAYCYRCRVVCLCIVTGVICAKMVEPIDVPFRMWTIGARNYVLVRALIPPSEGAFGGHTCPDLPAVGIRSVVL